MFRRLTHDEIVRVDSLCLGPPRNQDHATWDPTALRRFLTAPTQTTPPVWWSPLKRLWKEFLSRYF
jgi:hypothetical protein